MPRTYRIVALLFLAACGGDQGPSLEPLLIEGSDMGPRYQSFSISRGSGSVADAEVYINGVQVPTEPTGAYYFDRGSFLAPGETLLIRVVHAGETVEGRATIVGGAALVAPVADQPVTTGQPVTFTWTAPTSPDYWRASISFNFNNAGQGFGDSLGAAARTHGLATGAIPSGATNLIGYLFGYQRGTFTGPVDPRSTMRVRTISLQATLTKP